MSASRWSLAPVLALFAAVSASAQTPESEAYKAKVLAVSKKIDELIYAKQKEAGVKAGPKAEDGVYFRRLNIDLIGRIPNLLDIDDFLANDDADKRWQWVERLLAHERAPSHLAALFRAHIIGTTGQFAAAFQPQFEAYLKDRFDKGTPYDKIVHEILTSGNAGGMGRGFGGPGGGGNPSAFFFVNENKPENLASATTRVFLGVKLECAQCHPHPFAKWTQEQFWEFAAFYSGQARFSPRPVMVPGMPVALPKPGEIEIPGKKKVVKAKFLGGDAPAPMEDSDDPQKVLADWVVSAKNPYFAKATADFVWSNFFGVSLLEPIMEPNDDAPITHPELLDLLAREFIESKYDLKHLTRIIVHTEAYQRASVSKEKLAREAYDLFVRMPVRGLTPEQAFDSVAEATDLRTKFTGPGMAVPFPGGPTNPRAEFLTKFVTQDRRHETQTSILQALYLMNGKFLNDRLQPENNESLRILMNQPTDAGKKVRALYLMVLSRQPRVEELDRCVRYIDSGGPTHDHGKAVTDVYWALLNSGEFMLNH